MLLATPCLASSDNFTHVASLRFVCIPPLHKISFRSVSPFRGRFLDSFVPDWAVWGPWRSKALKCLVACPDFYGTGEGCFYPLVFSAAAKLPGGLVQAGVQTSMSMTRMSSLHHAMLQVRQLQIACILHA